MAQLSIFEQMQEQEPEVFEGEALPEGWAWADLGEIAELVGGGTPSRQVPEYFTGEIVWLTPTEIPKNRIATLSTSREQITVEALRKCSARLVPEGTVLMTSRASIGYVALAGTDVTTNQGFASFICHEGVNNWYLAYFLWANADNFEQRATGTTFKEISKSSLRPFPIPIPPLAEQERIVAEIEQQFTRLDAGVAALKRAQANLKRYKAAVLKAACEGALVSQDPNDEPAAALLARILTARRAKWEADLRAKGKNPATARYDDPAAPDTTGLPELPENWAIASMDQLTSHITSGSRDWSKYYGEGTGTFLMAQNVRPGFLDLSFRQSVNPPVDDRDRERSQVQAGDLLVTIVGANTGNLCRVPTELPEHYVCQSVALMRLVDPSVSAFVSMYMVSPENGQKQYERYIYGAGRPHLSFDQLKVTAVVMPPLNEQERIMAEVERRLSVVQEQEIVIAHSLTRAERLRQAILAQAFAGNLVPQDPSDEPASALLARIRATRDHAPLPRRSGARRAI
ncbi:MAG: restriction endonuclease subunit S [Thermomicrobiales bacterium]